MRASFLPAVLALLSFAPLPLACTSTPGTTTDAGTDAALGACPATLPSSGAPCPLPSSTVCEYGTPRCTTTATCVALFVDTAVDTSSREVDTSPGGGLAYLWSVTVVDPSCKANAPSCPATLASLANGSPCPIAQGDCTYAEGRCACPTCELDSADGGGSLGHEWECAAWPAPAGCPAAPPFPGTACPTDGQTCAYGAYCCDRVDTGPYLVCTGGVWTAEGNTCECALPEVCAWSLDAGDAGAARAAPAARVPRTTH